MENTQRAEEPGTPSQSGGLATRSVPADWFLDPAAPGWSDGSELPGRTSLEDQATALLARHDAESSEAPASARGDAMVTALFPSEPTAPEHSEAQSSIWEALSQPLAEIEGELAWQVDALCAQTDPEAFFPEKGGSTRDAKKICASCTVRSQCLDYAMQNDERFGIWGGLSERERRRLRKLQG